MNPIPAGTEYAISRIGPCKQHVLGIRASQEVRQNLSDGDEVGLHEGRSDLAGRFHGLGESQNAVKSILVNYLAQRIRTEASRFLFHARIVIAEPRKLKPLHE